MASSPRLHITHFSADFAIDPLDDSAWDVASQVLVSQYWSGLTAAKGREFSAKLSWSDTALYVRFDAQQREPLIVSENPNIAEKTRGLWDRDVCEIFVAPDKTNRNKYFEFEIAPTGEWVDLGIDVTPAGRQTALDYASGMASAARIEPDKIVMAIKIPWKAFDARPRVGDVWLGNLFRCVGEEPDRGYLAWHPTETTTPNFHIPEKFGEFHFVK